MCKIILFRNFVHVLTYILIVSCSGNQKDKNSADDKTVCNFTFYTFYGMYASISNREAVLEQNSNDNEYTLKYTFQLEGKEMDTMSLIVGGGIQPQFFSHNSRNDKHYISLEDRKSYRIQEKLLDVYKYAIDNHINR